MKAEQSGSIWSVAPVSATTRLCESAGETAQRREETNSEGRTMSSPEAAESNEIPHLIDPTEEDRGGTDSVETREHDGK
jgi:hypothetical protein